MARVELPKVRGKSKFVMISPILFLTQAPPHLSQPLAVSDPDSTCGALVGKDRAELGVKLGRVVTFSGLDNLCPPRALKSGKFSSELLNLGLICSDPIFLFCFSASFCKGFALAEIAIKVK